MDYSLQTHYPAQKSQLPVSQFSSPLKGKLSLRKIFGKPKLSFPSVSSSTAQ
jgi:hypothetical protein